jgi:hypothetical protein
VLGEGYERDIENLIAVVAHPETERDADAVGRG